MRDAERNEQDETVYSRDKDGNPKKSFVPESDDKGKVIKVTYYEYDEDGNRKKVREVVHERDESGEITKTTAMDFDRDSGDKTSEEVTEYDDEGRTKKRTTTTHEKGEKKFKVVSEDFDERAKRPRKVTNYRFDKKGNPYKVSEFEWSYEDPCSPDLESEKYFDKDGNPVDWEGNPLVQP